MPVPETLLEVRSYEGSGYQPLVAYKSWRVAVLRYADSMLPPQIDGMQRHDETDEVFVLLAGRCILFLGEGTEQATAIHAQDLEQLKRSTTSRRPAGITTHSARTPQF